MKKALSTFRNEAALLVFIIIVSAIHYRFSSQSAAFHNFYRLLYIIPIIWAAFKFRFKGVLIISILISTIYSPHILLSMNVAAGTFNELSDILLFFTVGVLVGTLSEKSHLKMLRLEGELKRYVLLEQYSSSIIESIKSGVITVNNDLLVTLVNEGAKNILNISDDCIGQNFADLFLCCEEVGERIIESMTQNRVIENIEKVVKKGSREVNIRMGLYPLSLEGVSKGLVIIIEDITEVKRLQQSVQRNDRLAALGELSAGVAHEIRNPLAIIKAIEQTMRNEMKDNAEAVKELEMIDEEVERANSIVKGLMTFAQPGKCKVENCSINAVLEDVTAITHKYAEGHNVRIVLLTEEIPLIEADKTLLKQAFINIIFNSVEAMPEGGTLKISTSKDKRYVKVVFEDTGIGIEKDNLEKIFNPFFTTKVEGTGLGLPIVHRIIEEHGGMINISSQIGEGTQVELLIAKDNEL